MQIRRALLTETGSGVNSERRLWVQAEKEDAVFAACMSCGHAERPLYRPVDTESRFSLYAIEDGVFYCQPCIRNDNTR